MSNKQLVTLESQLASINKNPNSNLLFISEPERAFLLEVLSLHNIYAYRTSVAKARGNVKNYSYWGTAEYRIKFSEEKAHIYSVAFSGARSSRRTVKLAINDTHKRANENNCIVIDSIGKLEEDEITKLLENLKEKYHEIYARYK